MRWDYLESVEAEPVDAALERVARASFADLSRAGRPGARYVEPTMKRVPLLPLIILFLSGCPETPSEPDASPVPDAFASDDAAIDAFAMDDAAMGDAAMGDAATASDATLLADARGTDATTTPDATITGECATAIVAIQAAAMDVWLLSESDRPITTRVFPGEGAAAPTQADVVRLATPPAGARSETRATDRFFRVLEPAPGASDTSPATLEAAITAGLSDLVYVAIVDLSAPAEVRVILAGRTACGEVVFVESVSIET
jgi:hypothetical protein